MLKRLLSAASIGHCNRCCSSRTFILHLSTYSSSRYGFGKSLPGVFAKALARISDRRKYSYPRLLPPIGRAWIHSSSNLDTPKEERKKKKLKGKRAVVQFLKQLRFKKMKEYQRMTAEERIQYKLNKARRKEERLITALNKIEPKKGSETTHDPEILTPEEHFYFLKMGLKSKNYVPIGRRGIYQGVILNMHLHWKKHQTLQVIVKTFTAEEVKEIAGELARLSGGIVLDIVEEDTIIMYRGKNYAQPPTEIMSPRITLSRKKALDKSKYLDALRNVRRFIPRLQREMRMLQVDALHDSHSATESPHHDTPPSKPKTVLEMLSPENDSVEPKEYRGPKQNFLEPSSDLELSSDADISDIFETDSDGDADAADAPLYMDRLERFLVQPAEPSNPAEQDFVAEDKFDEVDRIFLRAAAFLKKKKT